MPETSPYLDRPARSLDQYLDDLLDELAAGPLPEERAVYLAQRIRAVEAELAWRVEL